jgi:hypothetical protein
MIVSQVRLPARPCSCPFPRPGRGARRGDGGKGGASAIASRRRLGALAAVTTTWILIGRGNVCGDHLIRSRMQHPAGTCNLSMDGANPWVHVRGCPWSSVAVDVPTDVDQGGSSVAASDWLSACCQTADSGSGVSDLLCGAYPPTSDDPVSVLVVGFVARCDLVMISLRRVLSARPRGGAQGTWCPALRPTPRPGSRLGVPRGDHYVPNPYLRSGAGSGQSPGLSAV